MPKSRTELAAIWPPTRRCCTRGRTQAAKPTPGDPCKCLDCSYYQVSEIRLCEAARCPLWPFRAGNSPGGVKAKKPAKPS